MNNNKIVRISSKLYFDLYTRGGDKLIAVYSILKASRDGEIKYYSYKSKNNKTISGYALLRAKTNLTLYSIERYVPHLIDMGLCFIDKNGDFVVLGGQKVKELYNSYKLVPILIGKNVIDTAYNVMSVRIMSEEKQQFRQIQLKQNRSELLKQVSNPTNHKTYKKALKVLQRYGEEVTVIDKTVLSNQGYAYLKDGSEDNKSKGAYWKRVMKNKGIVKTRRRFNLLGEISFADYLSLKNNGYKNRRLTYVNGNLAEEQISSFKAVNLITEQKQHSIQLEVIKPIKEKVKPLHHLSFDMVAWWSNQN